MRRILYLALPLLVLVPAARALDPPKDKPAPDKPDATAPAENKDKSADKKLTPAEEFRAIEKEYRDKSAAAIKIYRQAKTDEERQAAFTKFPKAQDYSGRMMELAAKNPKDPIAPRALMWVVQQVRFGKDVDKARELLVKDYLKSDVIGSLCPMLANSNSPKAEQQLRTIMKENPSNQVKGLATLSLAQYLKNRSEAAGSATQRAAQQKEAEELFERVVKEYGPTLGSQAKGELFELRHLSIGKAAPEIDEQDVFGKQFKLSDYRGKVVLLDFWGNW